MNRDDLNKLSQDIIGAAIEVHRIMGPGLLEQSYHLALIYELKSRGHSVESEVVIPIVYKGNQLNTNYRADIIVDGEVIVELKATEQDNKLYCRQLYTYLKHSNKKLGLVINFNRMRLIEGLDRVVNNF